MIRVLIPFILLLPSAQALELQATPDHEAWSDGRYAVRPGNCMTWDLLVSDGGTPARGAGISITTTDGRRSMAYTGSDGHITVGTRDCHSDDHVLDIAFEVTGWLDGTATSSNRIVHEVMWSRGQVYVDLPDNTNSSFDAPVHVVWTATSEGMPVPSAQAHYSANVLDISLSGGAGTLHVEEPEGELVVSVPAAVWLAGGPSASIPVDPAGPFPIGPEEPDTQTGTQTTTQTGSQSGGGGAPPGQGPPPQAEQPERELPPAATPHDVGAVDEEGTATQLGEGSETANGTSTDTPVPLVYCLLALLFTLRRMK